MVEDSQAGSFEAKALEDLANSSGALINDELYFTGIDVNPEAREDILNYLRKHQTKYGVLHPMELKSHILPSKDSISLHPTKDQLLTLARDIDMAYVGDGEYQILINIEKISSNGLIQTSVLH